MADTSIRKDFIEGVQEIFTTLFNNGSEETDGVFLYLLSSQRKTNIYGERKYKTYQAPKLLVCQAKLNPTYGQETIEEIKDKAEFVVPLKSLQDNNLDVSQEALEEMRRGVLKYHDVIYTIDNIIPKAYVEDVFLMYRFICTEDIHNKGAVQYVEEPAVDENADLMTEEYSEDVGQDFFSSVATVSKSEEYGDKISDQYDDDKGIESPEDQEEVLMGMFTNVEESIMNDSDIQIPKMYDVISENGNEYIAYPTIKKYVGV